MFQKKNINLTRYKNTILDRSRNATRLEKIQRSGAQLSERLAMGERPIMGLPETPRTLWYRGDLNIRGPSNAPPIMSRDTILMDSRGLFSQSVYQGQFPALLGWEIAGVS